MQVLYKRNESCWCYILHKAGTDVKCLKFYVLWAYKMFKFNNQKHMRQYISKLRKIGGAHLSCVMNQYAKIEYKEMQLL